MRLRKPDGAPILQAILDNYRAGQPYSQRVALPAQRTLRISAGWKPVDSLLKVKQKEERSYLII